MARVSAFTHFRADLSRTAACPGLASLKAFRYDGLQAGLLAGDPA